MSRQLDDLQKELDTASKIVESNGLPAVRDTLKLLSRTEPSVLALIEKFRSDKSKTTELKRAEALLDRIVQEMARLIDIAAGISDKPAAPAASAPAGNSEGTPGMSESGDDKKHRHKHHHKHKDEKEKGAKSDSATPAFVTATPSHPVVLGSARQASVAAAATAATPPPAPVAAPAPIPAAPAVQPPLPPPQHMVPPPDGMFSPTPQQLEAKTIQPPQPMSEETKALMAGPPEIPPEEIVLGDIIGTGAFGKVYRGKVRGKPVAVKVPNKQDLSEQQLKMFRHEVTIMKKIFHQNVVLFLGACMAPGKLMIVTELMQVDVEHLIHDKSRPRLSLREKLRIANDAALGMNWLHGIVNIIHRDLKPANLLLDENMHVKVTDFGFSEVLRSGHGRDVKGPKGTALYMAPEVMRLEEFDQSSDVHSFGLILYELATETEPFTEYNDLDPFIEAVSYRHERPHVEGLPGLPVSLTSLMTRCWAPDPHARPTFSQIIDDLEVAIVDSVFEESSSPASRFWKAHFLKPIQEEVPWPDFENVLSRQLGVAPIQLEKLKNALAKFPKSDLRSTSSKKVVGLDDFYRYSLWFGNFFDPPNGARILREINQVLTAPWFHGPITQEEAQARLSQRADNTFLIRFSYKDCKGSPFTISKLKGVPVHKRIYRLSYNSDDTARFGVQVGDRDNRQFQTLVDLVDKLRAEGNLGLPCDKCIVQNPYSDYPSR